MYPNAVSGFVPRHAMSPLASLLGLQRARKHTCCVSRHQTYGVEGLSRMEARGRRCIRGPLTLG